MKTFQYLPYILKAAIILVLFSCSNHHTENNGNSDTAAIHARDTALSVKQPKAPQINNIYTGGAGNTVSVATVKKKK